MEVSCHQFPRHLLPYESQRDFLLQYFEWPLGQKRVQGHLSNYIYDLYVLNKQMY